MVLQVIDGDGILNGTEIGTRNTIQGSELIIPADIQTHIDTILAHQESCVDYIESLDEESRKKVLEVFQQVQRILKIL